MQHLSKHEQSAMLALMCRGKRVTKLAPVMPTTAFTTHTGHLMPTVEQFDEHYLQSIFGDTQPVAKKGQEWRDEIELQESGEIVGYWGEGQ